MTSIIVLIKLIAAHLVGDFLLQPDYICNRKHSPKTCRRYCALGVHALINALVAYIFVAQWENWVVPLVIGLSHFAIDWVKTRSKVSNIIGFVSDQFAHLAVILLLWWFGFVLSPGNPDAAHYGFSLRAWLVITSYIAVLSPASILIKLFMEYEKWIPTDAKSMGMPNAGKWIGYLERILILTFIFTGNIEGIGFLLAAKSVFRFGELNRASDIKTTEYVLIGTFVSFTIAILTGFGAEWLCENFF